MKTVSRRKLAILASIVIVIIVAGATGVYYLTLPNANINASKLPSSTHLKDGDYVTYVEKTFLDNVEVSEYPIRWEVAKAVFNETNCLVIKVTANVDSNTTTLIYWYMDKTTYECISIEDSNFRQQHFSLRI